MVEAKVIIVGGGPSGSACAWKLKQLGIDTLILDKKTFPRDKLCAGWITPKVFKLLESTPNEYPFTKILHRWYHFRFKGFPVPVKTRQYVIKRQEFDHWMLERSGVQQVVHKVETIEKDGRFYVIDGKYRCEYLVGAGGTSCPVYARFFKTVSPRPVDRHITALEEEFEYDFKDQRALFWYLDNGFPGYSWYTPKSEKSITIGIGGRLRTLKENNQNIRYHWDLFLKKLRRKSLVNGRDYKPKGWTYYVRSLNQKYQLETMYIIGDSAGMATVDMGEGIRPAIQSGILVAESIASKSDYSADSIGRYSFKDILFPG